MKKAQIAIVGYSIVGRLIHITRRLTFSALPGILCVLGLFSSAARAQDYLTSTGTPSFAAPYPAEMGFVDAASGNLHLEFPFGSFPQRGGTAVNPKLAYDSHIWSIASDGITATWFPDAASGDLIAGGWRLVLPGAYGLTTSSSNCTFDVDLWAPNGTQHWFHVNLGTGTFSSGCSVPTTSTYATDSSGLLLIATSGPPFPLFQVYAPDGTQVYGLTSGGFFAPLDTNGNYMGLTGYNGGYVGADTLNRQYLTTGTGSSCTFTSSWSGISYPTCFYISNAQGATSEYTLTFADIPVATDFGQPGVGECDTNCWLTVITKITQPDGSSYTFEYDCYQAGNTACNSPEGQTGGYYGTPTSLTLPTGQVVLYGYTNFTDVLGNDSHWLNSKSAGQKNGAWYYWNYSPLVTNSGGWGTGYPCATGAYVAGCQEVGVFKPDGSEDLITFAIDNGAWPSTIVHSDSPSNTNPAATLATVSKTWDFSNACTLAGCVSGSAQDVRNIRTFTTMPTPGGGNITRETAFTYDTPQTANVIEVQDWKYRSGTASTATFPTVADRTTNIVYATIGTNNNINRPKTITTTNSAGATLAKTLITYDGYGSNGSLPLQSITGVVNHYDTGYGSSYLTRGNPTQIGRLISGSNYVTTALSFDTTGQVVQVVDPDNNATTYSYADVFYNDNGADPPSSYTPAAPTNAYVTKITDVIGPTSLGYYFGSGQPALMTNYDSQTSYSHYLDPFNRPTDTDYPIGWILHQYHLPIEGETQIDTYAPVGDTGTASASCTTCAHTQSLQDALGRVISGSLVNNPAGQSYVNATYDLLNRISTASHPNFGPSDPNDVPETAFYDGLGRPLGLTHPDGESQRVVFGAAVSANGGLSSQLGSSGTYGLGFPVLTADETGKVRQQWIDGFGKVIEVDEPSVNTSTPGTGSVVISGSGPTSSPYESGFVQVTVNGFSITVDYYPGFNSTASAMASALASAINAANSPVTASASGTTVLLTSAIAGATSNYTLSAEEICDGYCATQPFTATASGTTLTGGSGGLTDAPYGTFYSYDAIGNLTGITQGAQTRSYQYDGLRRMTLQTTPEGGSVSVSYVTASGALCSGSPSNPCSRTDARGIITTYTYDTANRLSKKTHSDTTGTITYTYKTAADGKGLLSTMTDPSGSETYTYDKLRRITQLTKKVGSTSYVTKYAYNTASELTKLTYPSGRVVEYSYDNVGHLCAVAATVAANCGASTTPYLTLPSNSYDATGRPLNVTYGNGVVATAAYSPQRGELASLSYVKGTTTLLGLNYYYRQNSTNCPTGNAIGNNGQIQCIADVSSGTGDAGRGIAYTYDALGRLLTAKTIGSTQYPAWGLSETYDRYDNRSVQTVTAGSGYNTILTVNPANNRITSPAFTYDASGNVIGEPAPTSATFSYDGEECDTGFSGNGSTATYTCDGNHLRVEKVVTGTDAVTTVYIYSGSHVIAEYDNSAAVTSPTRENIYGARLLATVTGSTDGSGGTISYLQRDHLSPRLYTDVNGNDVGEQGTYPFGESWYKSNTTSNWVYTTYERDPESGLDYAQSRSYSSNFGRFMSPDPLAGNNFNPQRLNRYAYVMNDPINHVDSTGADDDDDDDDDDDNPPPPPPPGDNGGDPSQGGNSFGQPMFDMSLSFCGSCPPDLTIPADLSSLPAGILDSAPVMPTLAPQDDGSSALAVTQQVLTVAGFIPGIGDVANLVNAGISIYRGNYGQAALFAFSAIPLVGELGEIGQAAEVVEGLGEEAGAIENLVNTGSNVVYRSVDEAGNVNYIGITNDIERRAGEQLADKGISIEPIPGLENLARSDARAVEQALIENYGLPNLLNKINSISPNNPIYPAAMVRAQEILTTIQFQF